MARITWWFARGWHLPSDEVLAYGVRYVLRRMKRWRIGHRLREATLLDEEGTAFAGALWTIASFA